MASASRNSWLSSGYTGGFDKNNQPTDDKQAQQILQREGEANQRRIRELNERG